MAVRPCIPYPDKRLRTPAEPVASVTETVRMIWDDMVDTMEAMPGVGLAAPQIGIMLRLAVVDASDKRGQVVRMANPEVLHASIQFRKHEEASPNLPGVSALIERPRAVTIRFLNEAGARRGPRFRRPLGHLGPASDRPSERQGLRRSPLTSAPQDAGGQGRKTAATRMRRADEGPTTNAAVRPRLSPPSPLVGEGWGGGRLSPQDNRP